ncbi:MAG: BadF/BadG/BcrA/BcrD ATPase family protein [bacterium]
MPKNEASRYYSQSIFPHTSSGAKSLRSGKFISHLSTSTHSRFSAKGDKCCCNGGLYLGVDGGATKTVAMISDCSGRVLATAKAGPSNPDNVGLEISIKNTVEAISKALDLLPNKQKISSTFIGWAAVEESFRDKKEEIKKGILKYSGTRLIKDGRIIVGSDQIVAFRSGSTEKNGVILIAGTGCVSHGWNNGKEYKTSGWGWLEDQGSGFWVGQEVYRRVYEDMDKRGRKTNLTKALFEATNTKCAEDLMAYVYTGSPMTTVPSFSLICDQVARKGDKVAIEILKTAGKNLIVSTLNVVRKLKFRNEFPIVLVGSLFKSDIVLNTVTVGLKKFGCGAKIIVPECEPVVGALRLAMEGYTCDAR